MNVLEPVQNCLFYQILLPSGGWQVQTGTPRTFDDSSKLDLYELVVLLVRQLAPKRRLRWEVFMCPHFHLQTTVEVFVVQNTLHSKVFSCAEKLVYTLREGATSIAVLTSSC